VAVVITVSMAFWLKFSEKPQEIKVGDVKRECIQVFQKFTHWMVCKDIRVDEICHAKYKIENVPVKILDTNLISFSGEDANMKFILLDLNGDILENDIFFKREKGTLIIKEIK
jgi:hypothetical protein